MDIEISEEVYQDEYLEELKIEAERYSDLMDEEERKCRTLRASV